MAGLYDFDPDAQVVDDPAIGWDDPDNSSTTIVSVTASDTLLGADTAARSSQAFTRTASDALLGSDTAARSAQAFTRTTSDTLLTSDAATRAAQTKTRTASDTLLGADTAVGVYAPTTTQPTGAGGKWDITRADREALDRRRKLEDRQRMLVREDEELLCLI